MSTTSYAQIKEGALFVSDSHYPHHGDHFLSLLQKLDSGEMRAPQLFLMGDNFDLLFGDNEYIQTFSSDAIAIIKRLSKRVDIYYFEGNHDFLLSDIFVDIEVYPRESQPVIFMLDGKRVGISHGDRYAIGVKYDIYCKLLRNRYFFAALKPLSKWLIDDRIAKLKKKNICKEMESFEDRVEQILGFYRDVDLVIEAHYHQGKVIGKYISLPSLACQKKIAVVRNGEILFEPFKVEQ